MLTRREEREQAFILLFEKSFNEEMSVSELYETALENEIIVESDFAKNLAVKVNENLEVIDAAIEKNSAKWKMNRISKVALAVMRLAICEILFYDDIPVGVSINEAVELCKKYASKDDYSFVNGVLSTIAKEEK
ncbi:MAG: transcription antitermination factor NusB [Clostridia bacterium]|nr:transcription antitermination factor NusB [Clostridia bacterium]